MEFNNKVVIVTGCAQGIGRTIAEEFQKQGAIVCSIDKQPGVYFTGDLAQQDTLEKFAQKVITEYGHVDYLINNAFGKFVKLSFMSVKIHSIYFFSLLDFRENAKRRIFATLIQFSVLQSPS